MNVVDLCSELVKIRSENPPGYTDDLILYLKDVCDKIGLNTRILKNGKKWNLISEQPSDKLLLCGHVDVVPALDESWTYPPFDGVIADGRVHGRGSTDMKGGCAALLSALSTVIDEDIIPNADIAFVCDEEGNGDFGMSYLVEKNLLHPNACLLAEPTPNISPVIGEKGIIRLHITFCGDAGHASLYPVCGSSAIMQACKFMEHCDEIHQRVWPIEPLVSEIIENTVKTLSSTLSCSEEDTRVILGNVSYNPGIISGGERINVIAQKCQLDLDMRIPWGCDSEDLICEISEILGENQLEVIDTVSPSFSRPGWLCNLTCEAIRSVYNEKALPGVTQAASDARHIRKSGAEVVMYGPGDLKLLHSVNESIPVDDLKNCRDIYTYILRNMPH